jgi:hypothetical protein
MSLTDVSLSSGGDKVIYCSHSKVISVKKVTFPRLELFGAVLLAEQIDKVLRILKVKIHNIHLWTDSFHGFLHLL